MEAFAIIGFIFGLSAFGLATANKNRVTRLTAELDGLKQELHALRGRAAPGAVD